MRFAIRIVVGFLGALCLLSVTADAQTGCSLHGPSTGAPYSDLDRTFQLAKQAPLQPAGVLRSGWSMVRNCTPLPEPTSRSPRFEWSLLPTQLIGQNNSAYPRGRQDGPRWSGRGWSAAISAGAVVRWGPLTGALAPVVSYQQNRAFEILFVPTPELSPYGSYFHTGVIDWPQRFGPSSFSSVHPGQSFLRVDAYGLAAGFSTENLRWGPARQNPILMSGAAAGFPHFFLGTREALDARVALLGLELIWGRLAESDYFDNRPTNDERHLAGLVATITPKKTGMTLGFARAFVRTIPPGGLNLSEEIFGPYTGVTDNPTDDVQGDNQLLSVFLSIALPEAGFEAYGEYAREDHWEDASDLLMQLDHSRGYTIGFEKVTFLGDVHTMLQLSGEATNLGQAPTTQSRRSGATFYAHHQVRQGHTHRGQLLGAPIGPGADAQHVSVDYLNSKLQGGVYYSRVRYDNDTYYRHFAFQFTNRGHDTEWTLGTRGGLIWRDFHFVADLGYSTRHNREFVQLLNAGRLAAENNFSLTVGAAWLPRVRRNDD